MASNLHVSMVCANAQANAVAALCNNGSILVYDGTQPTTPETAVTTQVLLATLVFGNPAFGTASGGVITGNPVAAVTIVASSTASWFRVLKSDGVTPVYDGNVGVVGAGTDMQINAVTLVANALLTLSSITYTVPGS